MFFFSASPSVRFIIDRSIYFSSNANQKQMKIQQFRNIFCTFSIPLCIHFRTLTSTILICNQNPNDTKSNKIVISSALSQKLFVVDVSILHVSVVLSFSLFDLFGTMVFIANEKAPSTIKQHIYEHFMPRKKAMWTHYNGHMLLFRLPYSQPFDSAPYNKTMGEQLKRGKTFIKMSVGSRTLVYITYLGEYTSNT